MKTNTKTKKSVATKTKSTVKPVKTSPKAKTTAKASAKVAPKVAAKKAAPAAKTVKQPAKKAVAVKKSPVKSAKPAPKTAKTAVKAVKEAPKAVKSAKTTPVKATKAPVEAKKVVSTKQAPVKSPSVAAVKPIIVKMPENQNVPARTAMIATVRPTAFSANRVSDNAQSGSATRPVYRPIQVINKPLTPLQPVRQMAPIAKVDEKVEFKKGDYVVYPAHGVGEIEAVETQIIGGMEIKLYAIAFEKDRMRLKVPVFKAHASGLRRLSTTNRMQDALKTLQGRAQVRRAMWSRRAQEYETKINSGDPVSIAEVLRDLKRSNDESEQSYSERQIYQSALERLAREVAAVEKITEIEAAERLENMIRGKRARAAAADASVKEAASA